MRRINGCFFPIYSISGSFPMLIGVKTNCLSSYIWSLCYRLSSRSVHLKLRHCALIHYVFLSFHGCSYNVNVKTKATGICFYLTLWKAKTLNFCKPRYRSENKFENANFQIIVVRIGYIKLIFGLARFFWCVLRLWIEPKQASKSYTVISSQRCGF